MACHVLLLQHKPLSGLPLPAQTGTSGVCMTKGGHHGALVYFVLGSSVWFFRALSICNAIMAIWALLISGHFKGSCRAPLSLFVMTGAPNITPLNLARPNRVTAVRHKHHGVLIQCYTALCDKRLPAPMQTWD